MWDYHKLPTSDNRHWQEIRRPQTFEKGLTLWKLGDVVFWMSVFEARQKDVIKLKADTSIMAELGDIGVAQSTGLSLTWIHRFVVVVAGAICRLFVPTMRMDLLCNRCGCVYSNPPGLIIGVCDIGRDGRTLSISKETTEVSSSFTMSKSSFVVSGKLEASIKRGNCG
jgi:hypothetical protein